MPRFRVKDTTINFHDSFDINNNNNNNNGNADEMNTYMYLSVWAETSVPMKVYILKDTLDKGQSHVCVNVNVDVVSVEKHYM